MKQVSNSAPTIFDVARIAGVSRGTVDRVVYDVDEYLQKQKKKSRKPLKL